MNGSDPGGFLTSSVTGAAGTVAAGAGTGALSSGFSGAWLGASIGSIFPGVGTLAGGAIGAGLGAAFGSLTGTSKTLLGVWDKLIGVTKNLIGTFAKFDPLLSAQQERWRRLDMQMGKAWAKTLAPTLKHITDIGIELKQRWTRLKISVFKSWEDVINKLISVLGVLARALLSILEFIEKLKSLFVDLIKLFTPFIESIKSLWEGFKAFAKWLGIFTPQTEGDWGGGPSWKPGGVPGYGESSAGGVGGGAPLLRGKFAPGMKMPEWAQGNKLEFTWLKDLKSGLWMRLDKILLWLGIKEKYLEEARETVTTTKSVAGAVAGTSITPSAVPGVSFFGKLATAFTTFLLAFRVGLSIQERKNTQPVTEEDVEQYRREHNLPKKDKPTSFLGGSILPGAAGMVQRAVGLSAFTSTPLDPKVRIQDEQEQREASEQGAVITSENEKKLRSRAKREQRPRERRPRKRYPRKPVTPETAEVSEEEIEEEELEEESTAETITAKEIVEKPEGNIIMQVLDSNQLLDMLAFSWDEIRTVLRHQQAEYTLLRYRMQTEGTYM